ncbi:MAG: hypothetical protein L6R42_000428 [Xanthoria sp. 1 TBL-2021]|nr:MAG: hypothetical protein L6R42_000428 [Xanthoria sp. 1 TBL-2021]
MVVYHTKICLELVKKNPDADIADLVANNGRILAPAHSQRVQQWAAHPMLAEITKPEAPQKAREQSRGLIKRYNEHHPDRPGLEQRQEFLTFMEKRYDAASASKNQQGGDLMDVDYDPKKGLPEEPIKEVEKTPRVDTTMPESSEVREAWLAQVKDTSVMELRSPRTIAILDVHQRIRSEFPDAKIVVFSKYLKYLDILAEVLTRGSNNVHVLRFDGTKSSTERGTFRRNYSDAAAGATMLIIAGSGGAGMNLTAGSHMIQCEVWWNSNDEKQAQARLYRQL